MSTYNGWSNYETWAVNLWMDNDQGSQEFWREEAERCWEEGLIAGGPAYGDTITQSDRARWSLRDHLKSTHEDQAPDFPSSVYSDLLQAALSSVNWDEIADSWLENYAKGYEPLKKTATT